MLYRAENPRFVAGFVLEHGRVSRAAPIIKWLIGMPLDKALVMLRYKRWTVTKVS